MLDSLLTTKVHLSPAQLFNIRFNWYPASFYPLEILVKSHVSVVVIVVPLGDFPMKEHKEPKDSKKQVKIEIEGTDGIIKLLKPRYEREPCPPSVFKDYVPLRCSVMEIAPEFIHFIEVDKVAKAVVELTGEHVSEEQMTGILVGSSDHNTRQHTAHLHGVDTTSGVL